MAEALLVVDTWARLPIEEDGRLARDKQSFDPFNGGGRETPSLKDEEESVLVDGVKGFAEVKFEHHGWSFPDMTSTEEVSSVDEILGNASPRYESLFGRHELEGGMRGLILFVITLASAFGVKF